MRATRAIIYCHTLVSTGQKYVGQTNRSMHTRWREHVGDAMHFAGCSELSQAIRKHGEGAFTHEELEAVAYADVASALSDVEPTWGSLAREARDEEVQKVINLIESTWIERTQSRVPAGFNLAARSALGPVHEATRQKISVGMRRVRQAQTPEERSEISRKANAAQTPEQRSERLRKGWSRASSEQRAQRCQNIARGLAQSSYDRKASSKARWDAFSPEDKARFIKNLEKTPEQRAEVSRLGGEGLRKWLSTQTPEQRLERSRHANAVNIAKAAERRAMRNASPSESVQ
jgi:hypothetical protein